MARRRGTEEEEAEAEGAARSLRLPLTTAGAALAFRFIGGDLEAAEARFDAARALNPELRPYLWQRGIAKYYLGKFDEAAEQVTARPRPVLFPALRPPSAPGPVSAVG